MYWLIESIVVSSIITLGWTLMFNVPRRYILYCLLLTILGHGLKTILIHMNMHLALATFFGSMLASFTGVYFSKRLTVPPKALIVPSLICLMPGIVAYKAMVAMIQIGYFGFSDALFTEMMSYAFQAIFVASALVLGLSIPSTMFYRRKPIV